MRGQNSTDLFKRHFDLLDSVLNMLPPISPAFGRWPRQMPYITQARCHLLVEDVDEVSTCAQEAFLWHIERFLPTAVPKFTTTHVPSGSILRKSQLGDILTETPRVKE